MCELAEAIGPEFPGKETNFDWSMNRARGFQQGNKAIDELSRNWVIELRHRPDMKKGLRPTAWLRVWLRELL
jgi:hypothetical protein